MDGRRFSSDREASNLWAAPGSPVAPNCDLKRVGEPKSDGRSRFMRACDLPIHQPKIKSPSLCSAKKKLYKQKDKGYKDGKEMYWASADPVVKDDIGRKNSHNWLPMLSSAEKRDETSHNFFHYRVCLGHCWWNGRKLLNLSNDSLNADNYHIECRSYGAKLAIADLRELLRPVWNRISFVIGKYK
ncbi:hypothetical protein GEV33_002924 [Tenebrio molitor]|uniref:Uncharacterized protein n=1 Tax=Tenebrio molitor TaxID=7067 RepID=A0A8J6HT56_TENMO|nr:hypothetical protein GEV33_002924 [Tenebrio molitor]